MIRAIALCRSLSPAKRLVVLASLISAALAAAAILWMESSKLSPASREALIGTGRDEARENEALLSNPAGIEWVRIPGGSMIMGAEDLGAKPTHRVKVKSFDMAKTLATFKQYRACVKAGACAPAHVSDGTCYVYDGSSWRQGSLPSTFQGDDQPAVCVDWGQAKAFSEWAGGRLPTEAEWEYAARSAGKDRSYPWGDEDATCGTAVMDDGGNGCGRSATWPVCSKPKGNTKQGLCDMAGNAWQWVQDWHHNSYEGARSDGSAWEDPEGWNRVIRGGSWYGSALFLRAAYRGGGLPRRRYDGLGFRLARSIR